MRRWLLTLAPELDRERSPCDWLVAGLKRNGLGGPLRELYRRELAASHAEALSDRCVGLMDAAPAPPLLFQFRVLLARLDSITEPRSGRGGRRAGGRAMTRFA